MKVFTVTIELIVNDDFNPRQMDWNKAGAVLGARLIGFSHAPYQGDLNRSVAPGGIEPKGVNGGN